MSTAPHLSLEEYLAIERKAEFKSEYYDGQMFAMAGASTPHNQIAFQLCGLAFQHLRGTDCQGLSSDQRVLAGRLGTYPDMSVVCGERQYADGFDDTLVNPILIAEVLSPSTEAFDRGNKAEAYRRIPTLREYLLIAQDRPKVELQRRSVAGRWMLMEAEGLDAAIELESIKYTLRLDELYERVFQERELLLPPEASTLGELWG